MSLAARSFARDASSASASAAALAFRRGRIRRRSPRPPLRWPRPPPSPWPPRPPPLPWPPPPRPSPVLRRLRLLLPAPWPPTRRPCSPSPPCLVGRLLGRLLVCLGAVRHRGGRRRFLRRDGVRLALALLGLLLRLRRLLRLGVSPLGAFSFLGAFSPSAPSPPWAPSPLRRSPLRRLLRLRRFLGRRLLGLCRRSPRPWPPRCRLRRLRVDRAGGASGSGGGLGLPRLFDHSFQSKSLAVMSVCSAMSVAVGTLTNGVLTSQSAASSARRALWR